MCPGIEEARVSFLYGAMGVTALTLGDIKIKPASQAVFSDPEPEVAGPSSSGAAGDDVESLVSSVKDMLPTLHQDFIKIVLSCYDNNVER